VVVLRYAVVFCVTGAGEILVTLSDPDTVSLSSDTIPSWRVSWDSPVHYTLCTEGNPRTGLVRAAVLCRRRVSS
jgi:hypothetical protein